MAFKLGKEIRQTRSSRNTPIFKAKLDDNTIAEANNDGTIHVNEHVDPSSDLYKRAIKHEAKHIHDMETGRADYGDNWVMWEGKIYIRHDIDGEEYIDGPAGRLPVGHQDHPWEQEAIEAENLSDEEDFV
jgi:hypothetical protein